MKYLAANLPPETFLTDRHLEIGRLKNKKIVRFYFYVANNGHEIFSGIDLQDSSNF